MKKDKDFNLVDIALNRRQLLIGAGALLLSSACTRHRYDRPGAELDLGPVKELLYSQVHVPPKAILVFRDIDGWAALSTRCTYHGCDLTFQEPILLCPCCRTPFGLDGIPYSGHTATKPLPWVDVYYRDGHLYANPGVVHKASHRFTTKEIEEAIRKLREQVREETLSDEVKIPTVLTGVRDPGEGMMFLDEDPNLIHELKMIK